MGRRIGRGELVSTGCVLAAVDQWDARDAMNSVLTYLLNLSRPITRLSLLAIPVLRLCAFISTSYVCGVANGTHARYGPRTGASTMTSQTERGDAETRRWEIELRPCEAHAKPRIDCRRRRCCWVPEKRSEEQLAAEAKARSLSSSVRSTKSRESRGLGRLQEYLLITYPALYPPPAGARAHNHLSAILRA